MRPSPTRRGGRAALLATRFSGGRLASHRQEWTGLTEPRVSFRARSSASKSSAAGRKPSTPAPAVVGPNSPGEFGQRFIESQREQREKSAQDAAHRAQERRDAERRELEERKIPALERGADAEEQKARALKQQEAMT